MGVDVFGAYLTYSGVRTTVNQANELEKIIQLKYFDNPGSTELRQESKQLSDTLRNGFVLIGELNRSCFLSSRFFLQAVGSWPK